MPHLSLLILHRHRDWLRGPALSEPHPIFAIRWYFAGFQTLKVGAVPRSSDSETDQELTAGLAALGLVGSSARYERWRRAGLLPRHERYGAGRGHGSTSKLALETVEIAAALARHAVQGRDLRATVVAWFFEAGYPAVPGKPAVPEPPDAAVAGALAWAVRIDPGYRMLQRARAAVTETQKDDFYAVAAQQARRGPGSAAGVDPEAMREALLGGRDIPKDVSPPAARAPISCTSSPRSGWASKRSAPRHSPTQLSPPACSRSYPRSSVGTR